MRIWWIVMVCALGAIARGQGLTSEDWKAIQAIPEWVPQQQDYSENFAIDLRGKLPPPGEQKMNDCAAWAIAYAAKTYDEVVDQEWRPDAPKRIFSPRFLYNQINNGRDSGSNALAALNLLKSKGCATMATCAYVPNDFRGQPSAAALKEAENFKISGFYTVRSKEGIRRALLQGKVVVIGASTTPVFMSGRWQVYDRALHQRGVAERRPGQPHGKHAMCIVGFDDQKSAFLVMNSWGTRWGNGGFYWLSYELADRFNAAKEGPEFMDYALIIEDERAKVIDGPAGYATNKPDKESIRPVGSGEYRGYDAKAASHRFWYTAAISGARPALDLVTKVDWAVVEGNTAGKASSATDRVSGFATNGTVAKPVFQLRGTVSFKDNTTRVVTLNYNFPPPSADNREVKLAFEEEYYGKLVPGGQRQEQPWWHWEVSLDGRLTDLRDVVKVAYHCGNMDRIEPNRVLTVAEGRAAGGRFTTSGIAMATNPISAEVTFSDGSVKKLTLDPRFESPADDSLRLETSFREAPGTGERPMYDFTLRLNGPRARTLLQINKVVYEFGPMFGNAVREASWGTSKFDVSGSSHRDFLMKATAHLAGGRTETIEKWIELGPSARYADAFRLDVEITDRYYGLVGGKPTWLMTLIPTGDPRSLARAEKAVYKLTDASGKEFNFTSTRDKSSDIRYAEYVAGRVQGTARIYFDDGNSTILKIDTLPRSPRIDALELSVSTAPRKTASGPQVFFEAALEGPESLRNRVQTLDLAYVREGIVRRMLVDPTHKEWGYLLGASDSVDKPTMLSALLTTDDLMRQEVSFPAEPTNRPWSGPSGDLRLVLRENFWGVEDGKPMWGITAAVVGSSEQIAQVKKATFRRASDDLPTVVSDFKKGISTPLGVYRPDEIIVDLELDGPLESLRMSQRTTALGGRTAAPLELRTSRLVYESRQAGFTQWRVWLVGWEQRMRQVKKVEYRVPKFLSETPIVRESRYDGGNVGFALNLQSKEPVMVDAIVTLDDGKTVELAIQANLPAPPLSWRHTVQYYDTLDGKDQFLVNFQMAGPTEQLRKLDEVAYVSSSLFGLFRGDRRRYSWPNFEHQCFTSTAFDLESVIVRDRNGVLNKLPGGPIKPAAPVQRELAIKFARGFTWKGQTPEQTEWIAYLAGPEKEMERITEVTWAQGSNRPLRITRRHGERFDGFECRFYGKDAPEVSAMLKMADGKEMKVEK